MDQSGPDGGERKDLGRAEHPVRTHEVIPPDVQMEQRHVLQTPGVEGYAVLLACGAARQLLLRRRLRRLPVHARPQQDLRLHDQPLRLAAINTDSLARDD